MIIEPEQLKRGRGRPRKPEPEPNLHSKSAESQEQQKLLRSWEKAGQLELARLRLDLANDSDDKLDEQLSVAGAAALYLNTLVSRTKATRDSYQYGCRRFMWFLYEANSGPALEVKVLDLPVRVLLNYNQWLINTYGSESPATVSLYLTVARNLFEYLAERELTPQRCQFSKLIAGLKRQRIRSSYKTPRIQTGTVETVARAAYLWTEQAIEKESLQEEGQLENEETPAIPSPVRAKGVRSNEEKKRLELIEKRNRAIILTLYTTGMRRGEVAKLNREDVEGLISSGKNLVEGNLKIIITGKGRKERSVFLDLETLGAITEYLQLRGKDTYRPLFLQHHSNRNARAAGVKGENYRVKPQAIWLVVRDFSARIGVKLTPHKFRHNLATTLLNNGAQLGEVQELLGHANPATTKMIYAHYSNLHLREAFDKYRNHLSSEPDKEKLQD